jgi:hypothetical protein
MSHLRKRNLPASTPTPTSTPAPTSTPISTSTPAPAEQQAPAPAPPPTRALASVPTPTSGAAPESGEDGSLVTEYGLLAVVAATIAGVVIAWASNGALVTLFNALLRHARSLVGA